MSGQDLTDKILQTGVDAVDTVVATALYCLNVFLLNSDDDYRHQQFQKRYEHGSLRWEQDVDESVRMIERLDRICDEAKTGKVSAWAELNLPLVIDFNQTLIRYGDDYELIVSDAKRGSKEVLDKRGKALTDSMLRLPQDVLDALIDTVEYCRTVYVQGTDTQVSESDVIEADDMEERLRRFCYGAEPGSGLRRFAETYYPIIESYQMTVKALAGKD